jgi:hypothetical protein
MLSILILAKARFVRNKSSTLLCPFPRKLEANLGKGGWQAASGRYRKASSRPSHLHFPGIIQHWRGNLLASTRLSHNINAHHQGETGWPVITHRKRHTVSPNASALSSSPGRLRAGHDGLDFPMRSVEADWLGSKNEEGQIARLNEVGQKSAFAHHTT